MNVMTLPEMSERLSDIDVITLIELLNITSQDIVERFQDYIEDSYDMILFEIEGTDTDE
jgi:hypothetical protein